MAIRSGHRSNPKRIAIWRSRRRPRSRANRTSRYSRSFSVAVAEPRTTGSGSWRMTMTEGCCPAKTVGSRWTMGCVKRTCISPRKRPGLGPLALSYSVACRTLSRRRPPPARNGSVPTPAGTFRSRCSSPLPGEIVPEGEGVPAALLHRNFLFCLAPSCGVTYTRTQRSERFKLATLGVDSRSTATTILAVRSLIKLQRGPEPEP